MSLNPPNSNGTYNQVGAEVLQLFPIAVLGPFAIDFMEVSQVVDFMAPEVGLEPTTLRLTAECSAIELLRSVLRRE